MEMPPLSPASGLSKLMAPSSFRFSNKNRHLPVALDLLAMAWYAQGRARGRVRCPLHAFRQRGRRVVAIADAGLGQQSRSAYVGDKGTRLVLRLKQKWRGNQYLYGDNARSVFN